MTDRYASYPERLATALADHIDGPLGPRRLTDLVRRLQPLLVEARAAGEGWDRICDALSLELSSRGRAAVSAGTLSRLYHRVQQRELAAAHSIVRGVRFHPTAERPPSETPQPTAVRRDFDINHRSAPTSLLSSNSPVERLKALRELNKSGDQQ